MTATLTMGRNNRIFSFSCIGIAPQDLKYAGEPTPPPDRRQQYHPRVRYHLPRAPQAAVEITRVGRRLPHHGLHPHRPRLADRQTACHPRQPPPLSPDTSPVEDYAVVGALCPVHQFCRIGRHAYIGGGTTINSGRPPPTPSPPSSATTTPTASTKVGLERRGFTPQQLKELRTAYRTLLASKLNISDGLAAIRETIASGSAGEHVAYLADFIANSQRGIIK